MSCPLPLSLRHGRPRGRPAMDRRPTIASSRGQMDRPLWHRVPPGCQTLRRKSSHERGRVKSGAGSPVETALSPSGGLTYENAPQRHASLRRPEKREVFLAGATGPPRRTTFSGSIACGVTLVTGGRECRSWGPAGPTLVDHSRRARKFGPPPHHRAGFLEQPPTAWRVERLTAAGSPAAWTAGNFGPRRAAKKGIASWSDHRS
jgi:hypothetical protein